MVHPQRRPPDQTMVGPPLPLEDVPAGDAYSLPCVYVYAGRHTPPAAWRGLGGGGTPDKNRGTIYRTRPSRRWPRRIAVLAVVCAALLAILLLCP